MKLDTHSVELARYDMPRLAFLSGRDSPLVTATGWLALEESGHHRDGLLVFQGRSNSEWEAEEKRARLTVKDVAGVAERSFLWEF